MNRVLVIGAGPSGLAAALKLAQLGVAHTIVERRTEPSLLSRAVGILPETVAKLDSLGVGAAVRAEAVEIREIRIYRGNTSLMHLDFADSRFDDQIIRGLPQNRTEEIMSDGLQRLGGSVQFGQEVTAVSTSDTEVTVQFNSDRREVFDWVIAADGVGSRTRQMLDISYPGFDLDEQWSVADVDVAGYDTQGFSAWVQSESGDFVFVIPIEERRVRVAASTSDALSTIDFPFTVKNVRRTGTFDISVRQAETYKKGRVLLVGDAAHCHSPVGGRGMNLGIDDALAAAYAIANETTDAYSVARHAKGQRVIQVSERGRKIVCSNNVVARTGTTLMTSLVHHVPWLKTQFLRNLTAL